MENEETIIRELREAVLAYDENRAKEGAKRALEMGIDPLKAVEEGLAKGLREAGSQFERGEIFIPHLMVAAEAMRAAFKILEPEIRRRGQEIRARGTVVIGTIEGDLHDIGKNLVSLMLEASGFRVYDVGRDTPVDVFIEKAQETNADIIGVSALMTTTMVGQRRLIDRLKELNLYGRFKVMVGGASVTEDWAKEIGADAYAEDAIDAVRKAKTLLGQE